MDTLTKMINYQLAPLAPPDQLLYLCALASPYCGMIIATTLSSQNKGWLRWSLAWLSPLFWSTTLGLILSQVPAKDSMLLVASFLVSIPITLLYYTILTILTLGHISDHLFPKRHPNQLGQT